MLNTNPDTHVAFGVISMRNLEPSIYNELWYGPQAKNLSEEQALADIAKAADAIEEECRIAVSERGYHHVDEELALEAEIEAAYERLGYQDRDHYLEGQVASLEICEHTIEGVYQGVTYCIQHLGGAEILFISDSPVTCQRPACSPCCPGAGDLDSDVCDDGIVCYDVLPEWRAEA